VNSGPAGGPPASSAERQIILQVLRPGRRRTRRPEASLRGGEEAPLQARNSGAQGKWRGFTLR